MTIKKAMFCHAVPALIAGVAIGYAIHPAPSDEKPAAAAERPAPRVKNASDESSLNRLRARIRELERQLAEASARQTETRAAEPAAEPVSGGPANPFLRGERPRMPTAAEMRANMEELRKADPGRYTQMTNRFAHWQAHRLQRAANRLDILASVNTSGMSDREREVHNQLQDLIARKEELREMLNPQNEDATEDQRKAAFDELRRLEHEMYKLESSERDTLLAQTAASLGLSGSDASEMVETVKAIYQATQSTGHRGLHGGPGRH